MKKLFLSLMVLLSACSSAFAGELDSILKDCKLDTSRWLYVNHYNMNNDLKFAKFFDSQAVVALGSDEFETVICDYCYDGDCGMPICQDLKTNKKKHYHRTKTSFNTKAKTYMLKSFAVSDNNDKELGGFEVPSEYLKAINIRPNSENEMMMTRIKGYVGKGSHSSGNAQTAKKQPKTEQHGSYSYRVVPTSSYDSSVISNHGSSPEHDSYLYGQINDDKVDNVLTIVGKYNKNSNDPFLWDSGAVFIWVDSFWARIVKGRNDGVIIYFKVNEWGGNNKEPMFKVPAELLQRSSEYNSYHAVLVKTKFSLDGTKYCVLSQVYKTLLGDWDGKENYYDEDIEPTAPVTTDSWQGKGFQVLKPLIDQALARGQ